MYTTPFTGHKQADRHAVSKADPRSWFRNPKAFQPGKMPPRIRTTNSASVPSSGTAAAPGAPYTSWTAPTASETRTRRWHMHVCVCLCV